MTLPSLKQSSSSQEFYRITDVKNSEENIFLFNKVKGFCNKKGLCHCCFPWEFEKFSKTVIYQINSWRLLLSRASDCICVNIWKLWSDANKFYLDNHILNGKDFKMKNSPIKILPFCLDVLLKRFFSNSFCSFTVGNVSSKY